MWHDLIKVKHFYLRGRQIAIKNGGKTRFWSDPWLYDISLKELNPILFELCENKLISVAQYLRGENITFRRWLYDELRNTWEMIVEDAAAFQPAREEDIITWDLKKNGKFSVKSLYDNLTSSESGIYHKRI